MTNIRPYFLMLSVVLFIYDLAAQPVIVENKTFENLKIRDIFDLKEENSGSVFRNCVFKNIIGTSIRISGAKNVLIEDCHFEYNYGEMGKDVHQIVCGSEGKNITIRRCTFIDPQGDGIQMGHGGKDIRNVLIEDCDFYFTDRRENFGENGVDFKIVHGNIVVRNCRFWNHRECRPPNQYCTGSASAGIVLHKSSQGVTIERCSFFDNYNQGIRIHEVPAGGPPHDIIIRNNFFYNNKVGVEIEDEPYNIFIYHNTFVDNETNLVLSGKYENKNNLFAGSGGINDSQGEGNLYFPNKEKAGFRSIYRRDYHLATGSLAIDQGNQSLVQYDIDGQKRSDTVDIGADEMFTK